MRRPVGRALGLADQLTRLDPAQPGPMQRLELGAFLDRLATRFSPAARHQGVALHVRGRGAISTDARLLETVLDNLVSNALRYTPAGGEVTIASHRHRRHTVISVTDTGIGIAPEHQRRIFDRFYRVEEARDRASGGSGIGLALAQRAAQALGAHIDLEGQPGGGQCLSRRPSLTGLGHTRSGVKASDRSRGGCERWAARLILDAHSVAQRVLRLASLWMVSHRQVGLPPPPVLGPSGRSGGRRLGTCRQAAMSPARRVLQRPMVLRSDSGQSEPTAVRIGVESAHARATRATPRR